MKRSTYNVRTIISARQVPGSRADAYAIQRRGRFWALLDPAGELVCITVYKCGAKEVVRRLFGSLPS